MTRPLNWSKADMKWVLNSIDFLAGAPQVSLRFNSDSTGIADGPEVIGSTGVVSRMNWPSPAGMRLTNCLYCRPQAGLAGSHSVHLKRPCKADNFCQTLRQQQPVYCPFPDFTATVEVT